MNNIIFEFDYFIEKSKIFEKTLNFLSKSLNKEYKNIENEYTKVFKELQYKNQYKPSYTEVKTGELNDTDHYRQIEIETEFLISNMINDYTDISTIISESILIKINSDIEKFLVQLSKKTYAYLIEKQGSVILPYNYNDKETRFFTDSLIAGKRISEYLNQKSKITDLKYWNEYILMRNLRNKFAHGNSIFILNEKEFNQYNKLYKNPIVIKKNSTHEKNKIICSITPNIEPLIEFNAHMLEFIEIIRNQYNILLKDN